MASVQCDSATVQRRRTSTAMVGRRPVSAKILIAGGFGSGKTSLVAAVSEIQPVRSEAAMTDLGLAIDDRTLLPAKSTTTVAMDFGKITADAGLVLYLFGTPGQDRFGFMWDDVSNGALGALVIVDSRRLHDSYPAVDYFESRNIPFAIALNQFDGAPMHDRREIREALAIDALTPIITCDARNAQSARLTIIALLEHLLRARKLSPRPLAYPVLERAESTTPPERTNAEPTAPPTRPEPRTRPEASPTTLRTRAKHNEISKAFQGPKRVRIVRNAERPVEPKRLSSSEAMLALNIIDRVRSCDEAADSRPPDIGVWVSGLICGSSPAGSLSV